ncbi:MAG: pro-sigmaK processing inhibitor BofA family protein [archaeon]|nr:pro-sigmaK processing inhibitor BofA family protein [archaeon]
MVEIFFLGPVLSLVLLAIIILIALKFSSSIFWLIINSAIGVIALMLVNFLPYIDIEINIWSILITVFGGIAGIILLIILDLGGIAF